MAKRKLNSSDDYDDDGDDGDDGDDDDDDEEEEDTDWTGKDVKPKDKHVRDTIKVKPQENYEKEEGEDDNDDEMDKFNDGYDQNLMGDDDDQKCLALMTEKEREQELYNRSEMRDDLKTRFRIQKKLRIAKRKEYYENTTDDDARSTETRKDAEDYRKVKDTVKGPKEECKDSKHHYSVHQWMKDAEDYRKVKDTLKGPKEECKDSKHHYSVHQWMKDAEDYRKVKDTLKGPKEECKDSKHHYSVHQWMKDAEDYRKVKDTLKGPKEECKDSKHHYSVHQWMRDAHVYSSHSDSSNNNQIRRKSSSSSSSLNNDSHSETKPIRGDDTKQDDEDWGGIRDSNKDRAELWDFTVEHLNLIRFSRHNMELWCHTPFFRDTIVGGFVRICMDSYGSTQVYGVLQIVEVTQITKEYSLGNDVRTNKGLRVKHAKHPERVYSLEFVSNSEFTQSEFNRWKHNMLIDRCDLPSKEFVEKKKQDIENAVNYVYSDRDIDMMIWEKSKFKKQTANFALKKVRLMKEREFAEIRNDMIRVEEINQELDQLEDEANAIDDMRNQNIPMISYINQRNHIRNVKESQQPLEESIYRKVESQDLFTRRKCTPTVANIYNKKYHNENMIIKSKSQEFVNEESKVMSKMESIVKSNKKSKIKDKPINSECDLYGNCDSQNQFDSLKIGHNDSSSVSSSHNLDLFNAHNFDIIIDFDATDASSFTVRSQLSQNAPKTVETSNRRFHNLDEYKKMKGLI